MTSQNIAHRVETGDRRRESWPVLMAGVDRREFVGNVSKTFVAVCLESVARGGAATKPLFEISLAQWSLHRALRAGDIDALDFPRVARREFDIDAVEYVNQFYVDRGRDQTYLRELKAVADGEGGERQITPLRRSR